VRSRHRKRLPRNTADKKAVPVSSHLRGRIRGPRNHSPKEAGFRASVSRAERSEANTFLFLIPAPCSICVVIQAHRGSFFAAMTF